MQGDSMNDQSYDPEQHDTELVAAFEQRSVAEAARDALLDAGFAASAIELIGDAAPVDDGFWSSVRRLFAPDGEANELGDAVESGHVMVVVRPQSAADRERAIEVLEGFGPIDLEERNPAERSTGAPSVRIVEERPRVGWRDRSGSPSPVRRYVAERANRSERVELLEEEIAPSAARPPTP